MHFGDLGLRASLIGMQVGRRQLIQWAVKHIHHADVRCAQHAQVSISMQPPVTVHQLTATQNGGGGMPSSLLCTPQPRCSHG